MLDSGGRLTFRLFRLLKSQVSSAPASEKVRIMISKWTSSNHEADAHRIRAGMYLLHLQMVKMIRNPVKLIGKRGKGSDK